MRASEFLCLEFHKGKYPYTCIKARGHDGRHGAVRFHDGTFKYEWLDDEPS